MTIWTAAPVIDLAQLAFGHVAHGMPYLLSSSSLAASMGLIPMSTQAS